MEKCTTTYRGHHEGWGPVSTRREFDLTPCFEEGIILSTLLAILLIVSLFRLWGTKSKAVDRGVCTLTAWSAAVLKVKLVCSFVVTEFPRRLTASPTNTGLARGRFFRQPRKPHLRRVRSYPCPAPPALHPRTSRSTFRHLPHSRQPQTISDIFFNPLALLAHVYHCPPRLGPYSHLRPFRKCW